PNTGDEAMMRVTVLQRNEPWWSLLLVLLGLISPVPLHAGPLRTVIICSEYLKHLAVETLVTRRDLSRLPIVDRVTGHRITLELGERIGVGLRGAAYRVRDFEVEPGQVPRSSPQADARQTTVGL